MNTINKIALWLIAMIATVNVSAAIPEPALIPAPQSMELMEGTFKFNKKNLTINVSDSSLIPAAEYLSESLGRFAEIKVTTDNGNAPLQLTTAANDSTLSTDGAYRLNIRKDRIQITAAGYNGIINGISTLRQLLPIDARKAAVPCLDISDAPGFWWRGMMLDSSRHFWTIPEVEQFIDLMALYKMSVFHWHLIDNQGWRAESERYPELTELGGWRTFMDIDNACEEAAANDPSMRIPRDRMRVNAAGDSIYGGYYTKADMRHIVDYAGKRGIQVVPEFDVPGHSAMMLALHPEFRCNGTHSTSVCPGKDATLDFCREIFAELFEIFPSKYVHMGGDEVDKSLWHTCPDCGRRVAEQDLESPEELQAWFVRQMELFFRNNNRTLIGWDEIAHDGLGSEAAIMWWRGDNSGVVADATAAGKHVTCTPTTCLYFDYPQPETEIDKILALDPLEGLPARQRRLINGLQANVWTEYIPTVERMQFQIFPRMIALAEAAWNADTSHRLTPEELRRRLPAHLRRFDAMGINYQHPVQNP